MANLENIIRPFSPTRTTPAKPGTLARPAPTPNAFLLVGPVSVSGAAAGANRNHSTSGSASFRFEINYYMDTQYREEVKPPQQ